MNRTIAAALLAAILAAPAATAAPQDRWLLIGAGQVEGTRYYVDTESMSRDGRKATYWSRLDTPHGQILSRVQIDCDAWTFRATARHAYGKDGQAVDTAPPDTTWRPLVPDSFAEAVAKPVCEGFDEADARARGEEIAL